LQSCGHAEPIEISAVKDPFHGVINIVEKRIRVEQNDAYLKAINLSVASRLLSSMVITYLDISFEKVGKF
jgi:Fe-S cluster assembly scaffold protein SufB